MSMPIAGTLEGGRIRTLAAPDRERDRPALEVLLSWCVANGLPTARMLDRHHVEIREVPNGPGGTYAIHYREVQLPTTPGREARTELRERALLVEPEGLLAGELTCGHVHAAPSPVLDAPALFFTCDQGVDPATSCHPGRHTGGASEMPGGRRDELGTGYRMSWANDYPGEQAFQDGLPYVGDLTPDEAHALVLARLVAMAERRPRVDRRNVLVAIGPHVRGLRELAERHGPHNLRGTGIVCDHDFVVGTGITDWPCLDYRAAFAGIVAFGPPVVTQ